MNAKLTVYRVEQCGYYSAAARIATCSDLRKCLSDIHRWIHTVRPVVPATRTFNGDENGVFLPVYSFDVAQEGPNNFLFTTWNETPSHDGAIGAVGRSETAGEADVQTANLPADSIVGYPTHFWFLPDLSRVVTVRFEFQPLNGHVGLNLYLRGFLERFSPHVRFDPAVDDGNVFLRPIIGYALDDDSDQADAHLRPRYKSSMLRRDGEIAFIRQHRSRIKKVIRKGRPSGGGRTTRTVLDRVLTFIGATPNDRALPDSNFMFEVPYTPTQAELNTIINQWQEEEHETWDDVGFDIAGDTRRWLSNSTLKAEVELPDDLRGPSGSVVPAQDLLEALLPHRATVSV